MTGKTGWVGTSGLWVLAGLLWAVGIWTRYRHVEPDTHGLIDCAALIATTAAITVAVVRHFCGPRLKPGERVITDEMMERIEDTAFRSALIAVRQGATRRPGLRAVSGD